MYPECVSQGFAHIPSGIFCVVCTVSLHRLRVGRRRGCCTLPRYSASMEAVEPTCVDDTDHPQFPSGNVPGDDFSLKVSRSLVFKRSHSLNNA